MDRMVKNDSNYFRKLKVVTGLKMEDLFSNCEADTTPQKIEESRSIKRIIYVLNYYDKWLTKQTDENHLLTYQQLVYMNDDSKNIIKEEQKTNNNDNDSDGIYSWINSLSSNYNLTNLLDDFAYIQMFHCNDNNSFEILTNYVGKKLYSSSKVFLFSPTFLRLYCCI